MWGKRRPRREVQGWALRRTAAPRIRADCSRAYHDSSRRISTRRTGVDDHTTDKRTPVYRRFFSGDLTSPDASLYCTPGTKRDCCHVKDRGELRQLRPILKILRARNTWPPPKVDRGRKPTQDCTSIAQTPSARADRHRLTCAGTAEFWRGSWRSTYPPHQCHWSASPAGLPGS